MIASLVGLLVLGSEPVVAWLPPITDKTKLVGKQLKGFRHVLAYEGYKVLREAPPGYAYRTPVPIAWEKALQGQNIFLIKKGEAAPQDDVFVNDAAVHLAARTARTARADFYAYVTIDSVETTGTDKISTATAYGTLHLDLALTHGGGIGFSVKNHVTVLGHDQPIAAKDLAERFCASARSEVPKALEYIAKERAAEKKQAVQNGKSLKDLVDGLLKEGKDLSKIP